MRIVYLITILFLSNSILAEKLDGYFSGRISKVNERASLVRFKVDFDNIKYINKKDKIEFWNEYSDIKRCKGYVNGKSNDYILIRVPDFNFCKINISLTLGTYALFYSKDLENNLKMGRELYRVLMKKRLAVESILRNRELEIKTYVQKVGAVNSRYDVLRQKLEQEWEQELSNLANDRAVSMKEYNDLKIRLDEIDLKMERYRIHDQNMKLDRWSLDSRLYYRK